MTASIPTLLVLSPVGIPLYSARGLTQTYTITEEGKPAPRRTINGELVWLGLDAMKKVNSEIICTDQDTPAFDGLFPGDIVTVDCVFELAYKTSGGSPNYTVVSGSSRVSGDFTHYRPQITFMVTDVSISDEEYKHDYSWKISLKEV